MYVCPANVNHPQQLPERVYTIGKRYWRRENNVRYRTFDYSEVDHQNRIRSHRVTNRDINAFVTFGPSVCSKPTAWFEEYHNIFGVKGETGSNYCNLN